MNDLKFALRQLVKSKGFTLIALLTLALGIGVNTSIFTLTNALLLQPLPFAAPSSLMRIFRTSPQSQSWPHSVANYLDLKAQNRSFSRVAAYIFSSCNYAAPDKPAERWPGMDVTGEFFPILGIPAELGHTFTVEDAQPGAPPVVVLSHEAWSRRFNSDPAVVGRTIRLDGSLTTIIGVMPANFVPPLLWGGTDLWRPLIFSPQQIKNRDDNFMLAFGRLAPGVSAGQATAELDAISRRLAQAYPLTNAGSSARAVPLSTQPNASSGQLTLLVLALAGFVLLIACVNLANLQFTRTARRAREHAIRIALGASRWRIIRELLAESILLALVGGLGGLLMALWANDLLSRQLQVGDGVHLTLSLDLRVYGFALLVSTLAGVAFGLAPAWLASRADVNDALKQQARGSTGDRSSHRLRQLLIVAEVALALTLLVGAGVFIRGLQRFVQHDAGWNANELLIGNINLPAARYPTPASRSAFFDQLDQRLSEIPAIEHVALTSSLPLREYNSSTNLVAEGRPAPAPGNEPLTNLVYVNPGYFDTVGLRLRQGRLFNKEDRSGHPEVAIINEAMAQALWPGENPVGRRIGDPDPAHRDWVEIVGVVSDVTAAADLNPPTTRFQTYQPVAQHMFSFATVALRGRVAPEVLTAELRGAVAAIDPDQPVHRIMTARGDIDRALANYRLFAQLLGAFAVLGLALAALGIYGVLAGYVVERTPEIGIRMALGAQMHDVLRVVLGRGLRLTAIGALIGLIAAFAVVRLFSAILPGLGSPEWLTVVSLVFTLLAVASLACWLPALRATRIDPLTALRSE